ncbi:NHL domain-containing thioredoxin family protein [Sciscionella sediminilitoris]|uniref:NHL domain-containing thioredoxin family protein n=1 Tax=Sciscionella sediminilitoris TaxID=1445613 RepID=UPI0004DF0BD3|nr:NHL domain-containing thioredoxin family protein [Sciscionella sp. SE31]
MNVGTTSERAKVRAPELSGRGWLNTGGTNYSLRDFRGKFVLLDFWTFCCINCLHVLDELRELEAEFADVLVTIGVHSPKFEHEADPDALRAAVERYEVHHPVLDDPELTTWQQYAVRAWPTLALIDPEGYLVHVAAGEGHSEALRAVLETQLAAHEAAGTLHRGDGPYVPPPPPETTLRFPAKVANTPHGTLLVTDSARHAVVELDADGVTELRRFGTGERGSADEPAQFAEPSGIALLPTEIARQVGYDVIVADTANHLLRGLDLDAGTVRTVAGTGRQWRAGATEGPATDIELSSPWDVAWWHPAGGVVIAMAGNHTLSVFDPIAGTVRRFAGTTVEGLKDGPAGEAHFAQPSGLAVTAERLWLADAETSALRYVDTDRQVHTVIGTGLFDFGHRDGTAAEALLQHPLGVGVLGDGSIAIADTYNGALRRYDPATDEVSTLAEDLAEPSDVLLVEDSILTVASAAHRIERPVAPGVAEQLVHGEAMQISRPATEIHPGRVRLDVIFAAAPGQRLDTRYGPSTRVEVSASPPELLVSGEGTNTDLSRELVIDESVGEGVLHIVAQAASCADDPAIEHPACQLTRQDWGVPVTVTATGADRLALTLGGLDA